MRDHRTREECGVVRDPRPRSIGSRLGFVLAAAVLAAGAGASSARLAGGPALHAVPVWHAPQAPVTSRRSSGAGGAPVDPLAAQRLGPPDPWAMAVRLPLAAGIAPGTAVADTAVVRGRSATWTAILLTSPVYEATLRVYELVESRWRLSGVVPLGVQSGDGEAVGLSVTWLAGTGAPCFAVQSGPAEEGSAAWTSYVAQVGGRWQVVPFSAEGTSVPVFSVAAVAHLVEVGDGLCDCDGWPAAGSGLWYRYDEGRFVPTSPPGTPPPCTSAGAPGLRFEPRDVACLDGFAMAIEAGSRPLRLAVFAQSGRRWQEEIVASPATIASAAAASGLAVTDPVLRDLARRLGIGRLLVLPAGPPNGATAAPREPEAMGPSGLPPGSLGGSPAGSEVRRAGAPVALSPAIEIPPGASVEVTPPSAAVQQLFAVAVQAPYRSSSALGETHPPPVVLTVFSRRAGRWISTATVRLEVSTGHPEPPLGVLARTALTGSGEQDIELGGSAWAPAWEAVVGHAGGSWHVVPFVAPGGRVIDTIDSSSGNGIGEGTPVVAQEAAGTVLYAYIRGRFRAAAPLSRTAVPACRASRVLVVESPVPAQLPRSSSAWCAGAYGWDLVAVRHAGRTTVGIGQAEGDDWMVWALVAPGAIGSPAAAPGAAGDIAPWLRRQLEAELGL
ncbi:MAG TPA: hypothetical protein VMD59_14025 [Acidimicrobiales bacterium]|nr:hypothetical protein [Acidimicrobiales bacterium]